MYVRDVRAPHLVDAIHANASQQVRVNPVTLSRLTELRLRIDGLDSHQRHQSRYPLPVHLEPLRAEPFHHLPAPVKRRPRVLFVQQTHQHKVFFAFARWLVIQARPVHAQQLALPPYADLRMTPIHQEPQILSRAVQLFF